MTDQQWINDLRNKEQEFKQAVPNDLWSNIERNLPVPNSSKQALILPMWLRYGGVAATVIAILTLGGLFLNSPHPQSTSQSPAVAHDAPGTCVHAQKASPESSTNPSSSIVTIKPLDATLLAGNEAITTHDVAMVHTDTATMGTTLCDTAQAQPPTPALPAFSDDNRHNSQSTSTISEIKRKLRTSTQHNSNSMGMSLYAENLMNNPNVFQQGYGPMQNAVFAASNDQTNAPIGENDTNDIIVLNQGKEVDTHTRHALPMRLGASVNIPIYGKLSIESGITYSLLSSHTTSGSDANRFETHQKLHYVGMPVKLNYSLWSNDKMGFYMAAGGMVEKCVYGRSVTDYIIGNKVNATDKNRIKEKELQFSMAVSAGAKVNITPSLHFFAEPGVSYYINNGSNVINSYKDKPLNFDLKLGLRLTLNP